MSGDRRDVIAAGERVAAETGLPGGRPAEAANIAVLQWTWWNDEEPLTSSIPVFSNRINDVPKIPHELTFILLVRFGGRYTG